MIRIRNHRLMGIGFILGHSMKSEGQRLHTPWILHMPLNCTLYISQSVSFNLGSHWHGADAGFARDLEQVSRPLSCRTTICLKYHANFVGLLCETEYLIENKPTTALKDYF